MKQQDLGALHPYPTKKQQCSICLREKAKVPASYVLLLLFKTKLGDDSEENNLPLEGQKGQRTSEDK